MALRLALVFALAATALAYSSEGVLSKGLKSSLHEIASRYGMSTEEAMTLTSLSDPKSQILDKLKQLLTDLRAEQNTADVEHAIFVATKAQERAILQQTLDSVQKQLQEAQNQVNQNTGNIGSLSSQESDLKAQADGADSQVKLYEAQLDRLNQDHEANVAKYADIIQKHDDSLATLQQLIDMVANFQFNDALALLNKQHHNFLHRKSAKIALLVQASIELIQAQGPKNDIKQKLLALLDKIKEGTVNSRALYVEEAQNEVLSFNEESINLTNMINTFKEQRDSALAQLAALELQKAQEQDQLDQAQGSLDNLETSQANIGDALAALDAEVAKEAEAYRTATQDRLDDMNAVEAAIQYVNDHVEGMSVHDLCHIGAPGCYRCLTATDCKSNELCTDDGKCQAKPQPQLIGGTVDEHQTLSLSCPGTTSIADIQFASYGMPTGSFPGFATSWCDASSSTGVVASVCLGRDSCSVSAENDVFGDPCFGTFKHMSVVAVCE